MQWFKVDSLLAEHPKWMLIDDPESKLLWFMVGVGVSRTESDGIVRSGMLRRWASDAHLVPGRKLNSKIKRLVDVGLWHDASTLEACDECSSEFADADLKAGEFVFHNFNDWNPNKADKQTESSAWKANRRRRLSKLKKLKQEIYLRDRDYCRYCGIRVNMNDRISTEGGQLDHVDPDGENTLENLVRACRGCNIYRKGERTPQEAGMRLLPPPAPGIAPELPAWRILEDPYGVDDKKPKYPLKDPASAGQDPTPDPIPTQLPDPENQLVDPTPTQLQPPENQLVDPVLTQLQPPKNHWSDLAPASRDARVGPEPGRNRVEPLVGPERPGLGLTGTVRLGADRPGPGRLGAALLGHGTAQTGTGQTGTEREPPPPSAGDPATDEVEDPQR